MKSTSGQPRTWVIVLSASTSYVIWKLRLSKGAIALFYVISISEDSAGKILDDCNHPSTPIVTKKPIDERFFLELILTKILLVTLKTHLYNLLSDFPIQSEFLR